MLKVRIKANTINGANHASFCCPKCDRVYTFMMSSTKQPLTMLATYCSECRSDLPAVGAVIAWPDARIRYHNKVDIMECY